MNPQLNTLNPNAAHGSVVAALFADRPSAERAIDALRAAGFSGDHIGVAIHEYSDADELAEDPSTRAAEGAVGGAVGGGLAGGLAGFVIGLVAALAIPGVGPILAGGTLAVALGAASGTAVAGAGLGAAAGGLVGALSHLGLPETAARHFADGFRAGGVLLTVNAGPRAPEAWQLLEQSGGDLGPRLAGR